MSSIFLYGIGLGGGISIGNAYILDKYLDDAIHHSLDKKEVNAEVKRFEMAVSETKRELELLRKNIPADAPAELGAFLSLNIMMLNDAQISQAPLKLINEEECNAEWAIKLQANKLVMQFDAMEDEYLKERKHDVIQILERIFKNLEGNKFDWDEDGKLEHGILVAHDLSPVDLVHFKNSNFSAFVTEVGSLTSHTAIVGRNLDMPSLVGVEYARQLIREDDLIIVDGVQGALIINPDKRILAEYRRRQKQWLVDKQKLSKIRHEKAITKDEVKVEIYANIDSIDDLDDLKSTNASGVGLFRSEFLFLAQNNHMASEEEQFNAYKKIAKTLKKLPCTIRTADLGADKNPSWNEENSNALNPALGLTGIRLSLSLQQVFRTQLRALLRASHFGNLQIMFPMVSSAHEFKQALHHLEHVKAELDEENIPYNKDIKVGVMIEIPSLALSLKNILGMVDFVSIGTNDLIQYLLAIDRNDESVNYLYNPTHPAVLKVIMHIIRSANRVNVPVSICGEMASDLNLTRLLLGMGIRNFSTYSANILNLKNIVLNTDISSITNIVSKILKTENFERIDELVDELNDDLYQD